MSEYAFFLLLGVESQGHRVPRKFNNQKCAVSPCDRMVYANGYCASHYQQIRKHGKIIYEVIRAKKNVTKCGVWDCYRGHFSKGYCRKHYCQVRTHGSISSEATSHGRKAPINVTHPKLASEMVVGNPNVLTCGSTFLATWRCLRGHTWQAKVGNRARGSGCQQCRKIDSILNHGVVERGSSLAVTHPKIAKEAIFDASKVSQWNKSKAFWQCSRCSVVYVAAVRCRTKAEHGCPSCSKMTFDPFKDGWLYLIERPGQLKIGITNTISGRGSRLTRHKVAGWKVIDLSGPYPGVLVKELERQIKTYLDAYGVPRGKKAFLEPFDGYSEAWQTVDLEASNLVDLAIKLGIKEADYGQRSQANKKQCTQDDAKPAEGAAGGCQEMLG